MSYVHEGLANEGCRYLRNCPYVLCVVVTARILFNIQVKRKIMMSQKTADMSIEIDMSEAF